MTTKLQSVSTETDKQEASARSATTRAKNRPWTERDARAVLNELQQRGESIHAYARRCGVDAQRFYTWRDRIAKVDAKASAQVRGDFVPVRVTHSDAMAAACATSAPFEIVVSNGRVIRINEHFNSQTLGRLVVALEAI